MINGLDVDSIPNHNIAQYAEEVAAIFKIVDENAFTKDEADEINEKLKKANWMTYQLEMEIQSSCPKPDGIKKETGQRSQESFDRAYKKIFPKNGVFASRY